MHVVCSSKTCYYEKLEQEKNLIVNVVVPLQETCSIFCGARTAMLPLGRPRLRWEDDIKMDLREIGIDGANWIRLTQDRVQWRAFVNTVMNLRVS
jgi:hypothetical protein